MQVKIDGNASVATMDYAQNPIKPYERQRTKIFEFSSINEESKQPFEKTVPNKFQEKDLNLESQSQGNLFEQDDQQLISFYDQPSQIIHSKIDEECFKLWANPNPRSRQKYMDQLDSQLDKSQNKTKKSMMTSNRIVPQVSIDLTIPDDEQMVSKASQSSFS